MKTFFEFTKLQQVAMLTLLEETANYDTLGAHESDNPSWFTGSDIMKRTGWSREKVGGIMAGLEAEQVISPMDKNEWYVPYTTWEIIGAVVGMDTKIADFIEDLYNRI